MSEERATLSPLFTWRSYVTRPTEDNDLTSTERLVGLTLSLWMNEAGDSCFPGVEAIAERAGLGRRSVQMALRALQEKGALEVTLYGGRQGQGRGRTNHYRAAFGDSRRSPSTPSRKGASPAPFDGKGAPGATKGAPDAPESVTTTSKVEGAKAPSPAGERSSTGRAAEKDALVDALCRVLATPLEELPRNRRKRYGQVAFELLEVGATPEAVEDRASRWGDLWRAGGRGGDAPRLTLDSIVKWWADLAAEEKRRSSAGGPSPDVRLRSMLKWAGGRGAATFPDESDFLAVLGDSYKDLPEDVRAQGLEAYRKAKAA